MVEIIPKPEKKSSIWRNLLFYLSFFLLLLTSLSYFLLENYLKKAEATFIELEQILTQEKTTEEVALETEVFGYQRKIENFSKLIASHLFSSKFFEFIEKNSHPKIWFSRLDLNSRRRKAELFGQVDNFFVLDQQIQIFKANHLVENLNLVKVIIGKEGKVNFNLELDFSPEFFKYKL